MMMKHSFISLPWGQSSDTIKVLSQHLEIMGIRWKPKVSAQAAQDQESVDFKKFQIWRFPTHSFR